jgi:hypothetical protein
MIHQRNYGPAITKVGTLDANGMPIGFHIDASKLKEGEYAIEIESDGTLYITGILIPEMLAERRITMASRRI